MNPRTTITSAALAMILALGTAGVASAQHREDRGRSQDNARAQNSQPQRAQNAQPQRAQDPQRQPAQNPQPQRAQNPQPQRAQNSQPQRGPTEQAVPRSFTQAPRQAIQPQQDRFRGSDNRGVDTRGSNNRGSDNRGFDNRGSNNRGFDNRGVDNRRFDNRGFDNRRFSAPIVRDRFLSPRVIFPRVYRPGFSLGFGLFFGRPLPYRYVYPAYGYGYGSAVPATAYGAMSFDLEPGDAAVWVDGNYVGLASSFYDTTRPLVLTAGTHRIQLDAPGYEPVAFDVSVTPGQLIPYQGSLQPAY